jgi:hypothetical protein
VVDPLFLAVHFIPSDILKATRSMTSGSEIEFILLPFGARPTSWLGFLPDWISDDPEPAVMKK